MATGVWWGFNPRESAEITWAADALADGVEPDDIDPRLKLCLRGYEAATEIALSIDDCLRYGTPDTEDLELLESGTPGTPRARMRGHRGDPARGR